jgi:hypothetical protein
MTRRDILTCVHEPFGDAFYFGPERLSTRYENDEKARVESGFADSTFKTIFERIESEGKEVSPARFISIPLPYRYAMLSSSIYDTIQASASSCFGESSFQAILLSARPTFCSIAFPLRIGT